MDRNITGVEWQAETEIQQPETHIPQINNNQYAALAGEKDNEGNGNESTGVDSKGEITGVQHNDKTAEVDSENESAEQRSTGSTDEADKLALIEEAITEAERDIAEATNLLAGTETETEEEQNENVIHPALQAPTVEHTYNLRRRKHPRPD